MFLALFFPQISQEPSTRSPAIASPKRSLISRVSVSTCSYHVTVQSYLTSENQIEVNPSHLIGFPHLSPRSFSCLGSTFMSSLEHGLKGRSAARTQHWGSLVLILASYVCGMIAGNTGLCYQPGPVRKAMTALMLLRWLQLAFFFGAGSITEKKKNGVRQGGKGSILLCKQWDWKCSQVSLVMRNSRLRLTHTMVLF